MKALFINILELSVTTGVIILIFYLVCKLFGERIKSSTKYIVWVIVLLRLLLPFESSYSIIKYYNPVVQSASSSHENLSVDIDVFGLLCTVWLCVMAALFSVRMVAYISLAVKVRGSIKYCTKASQRVSVYVTNVVKTPCLFGLIFPKILLPYEIENKEDLELIIAHELYHHKRLDLWVKFIDNLIKCIYWFNPIVYLLSSRLSLDMEMSCDEAVLKNKEKDIHIRYAEMMIRVMAGNQNSVFVPMTTGFSYGFGRVKQRFVDILSDGNKRKCIFAVVIVLVLAILSGTVIGVSVIDVPVESKFTTLNKEIKEKGVVKDIDKEIAEAITKVETEPVSTESSTTTIAESVPMVVPDTTTMVTQAPETSTPYIETTIPEDTTTEYDIDTEDGPVKPSAPPPSALEFVSVCFDYNGGKPIYDDTYEMSCVVGSYMGYLPVAEREYYIFDGWWTVDSSGCYAVQYTTHTVVTESVTLVARWKEI